MVLGLPVFAAAMRKKQWIPLLVLSTLIVLFANDVVDGISEGLLGAEQVWSRKPSGATHRAAPKRPASELR